MMSGKVLAALIAVGLSGVSVSARASVEVVFLPQGQPTSGLAAALAALPGVRSAVDVFDASERGFLASQKAEFAALGAAVKLEIADADAFEALKHRKDLPGRFEINPRAHVSSVNPEQWGLGNTGKPQEVEITDIVSRFIQSVPGEDAGVLNAPAERAGHKILVAVIDTGVELTHPALASQVHRTQSECDALAAFNKCMNTQVDKAPCHAQYDNLDTDGNGYPLDCSGWDMTSGEDARTHLAGGNEVSDNVGHGTHVSGIIAGTGFISGVASQVEILPIKVLGSGAGSALSVTDSGGAPDPHAQDFTQDSVVADVVARGVLYAIRSHAQVLNMSLGYSIHDDSELMRKMVALAQSRGILVVAAAGNESSRTPVYPCRYAGVVCVASFSADGSISHFSDYGDSVDIAAPGYSILSAWPMSFHPAFFTERSGYDFLSGTSMATPFVVGVLARLLNGGFGPEEAFARMMLGARPVRAPTVMQELEPKFVLSGNLDLARAFAVRPQPLILPELKEAVLAPLDREGALEPKSAHFNLSLKNVWRDGARVDVRVALSSRSAQARARIQFAGEGASISRSFDGWASGDTRKVQGDLSWASPIADLPGEFYLEVSVSGPGMDTRVFEKSVEFVVPIRPMALVAPVASDPRVSRIATDLTAQNLPDNYAIKPITCLPSATGAPASPALDDDLLLISRPGNSTILQVLKAQNLSGARSLKVSGGDVLENAKASLVAFSCLDYNGDGNRGYVVTTIDPKDKKFSFTYFDSLFRHGRDAPLYSFSTEVVAMPDDFRWIAGVVPAQAQTRFPMFIARGKMPDSELPGFNPWETRTAEQVNPADQRLYYVNQDGIHTLKAPEGYHYVGWLKPTRDQLAQGTASVVLFKGTDYVLDFFVAPLAGLKLGALAKLDFSIYQRLTGLDSFAVLSQGANGVGGTVYAEEGTAGRMRLSVKPIASAAQANTLLPWLLEPTKPGDLLRQVIATFGDSAESAQAFSRSRFQLYFHDRKSSAAVGTDLKQYDSVTRHLPAWVDGRPALLLPEGQGASLTTELIVPRFFDGKTSLFRPASLKTLAADGCEQIQMKETGLAGSGGGLSATVRQLVYFCGDHFVEIAL